MRKRFAILAVSLACAVLAAEVGLRGLDMFEPPPAVPTPLRPELYQYDAELGYTLRPSTRTDYRYPVNTTNTFTLLSNSQGFRSSREFDEPDPRPRIWLLGDSMVLGEGVDADDRLTEVMERLEPGWRVDNLGMTGWGLDLMVRAFERVSRRVTPDVVVLCFYTDDFRRLRPQYSGMGYALPKFELVNGELTDRPFPAPIGAWRRVRVVQAIEQTYWRFARNRFDLNEALLNRLRQQVQSRSSLVVVFLPGRGDTAEDQRRRGFLRDWSARTETPYLDLTDTMQRVGTATVHIPGNYHWNPRGHEIAGTAIHGFLKRSGLLR